MARDLNAQTKIATESGAHRQIVLLKIMFDTPIYVHSDLGNVEYDGNTYLGVGNFGEIGTIEEVSDLSTQRLKVSLSGIPAAYRSTIIQTDYQGADATVYYGFRDLDSGELLVPYAFNFITDNAEITTGEDMTISVFLTDENAIWDRKSGLRYNDGMQKSRFPGDKFFEFQDQLKTQELFWGPV